MNEGIRNCGNASNNQYLKGCRCDACREARSIARKEWLYKRAKGSLFYVDAGPVRERLKVLYALGYTRSELVRFGVSLDTQDKLLNGIRGTREPVKRVKVSTAKKINAVSGRKLSNNQMVPVDAARLMVGVWVDAGLTYTEISRITGILRQTLRRIHVGKQRSVKAETLFTLLERRRDVEEAIRRKEDGDGRRRTRVA